MVKKSIIKTGQVVLLYSKPPDEALIGFVDRIDYPIITILVIPRSGAKNKFGKIQKIDVSKNILLNILSEEFMKDYLTKKEKKILKEMKKENETVDLFDGEH